ncbi:MAG: 2OG-Fe(II) oxygenase, partial [Pseudomonadota bacterium]
LMVYEWSGPEDPAVILPWTVITGPAVLEAVRAQIRIGYLGSYETLFFIEDKKQRAEVFEYLTQLVPKSAFLNLANEVTKEIGHFNCLHVRLSDRREVAYASAEEIVSNLLKVISSDQTLLILTDESDHADYFEPIFKAFPNAQFLDELLVCDYQSQLKDLPFNDNIVIALLSQYIARHAVEFIAHPISTFSTFIQRLRYFDNPETVSRYSFSLDDFRLDQNLVLPDLEPDNLFSWGRLGEFHSMEMLGWSNRYPECVSFYDPKSALNQKLENDQIRLTDQSIMDCFAIPELIDEQLVQVDGNDREGYTSSIDWLSTNGSKQVKKVIDEAGNTTKTDTENKAIASLRRLVDQDLVRLSSNCAQNYLHTRLDTLLSIANNKPIPNFTQDELCIVSVAHPDQSLDLLRASLEAIGYYHALLFAGPSDEHRDNLAAFTLEAIEQAASEGYRYVLLVNPATVFPGLSQLESLTKQVKSGGSLFIAANGEDPVPTVLKQFYHQSSRPDSELCVIRGDFLGLDLQAPKAIQFLELSKLISKGRVNSLLQSNATPTKNLTVIFSVVRDYLQLGEVTNLPVMQSYDIETTPLTYSAINQKELPSSLATLKRRFRLEYLNSHTELKNEGSVFSDEWKIWIWENIKQGADRESISQALLSYGFSTESINLELNYNSSQVVPDIAIQTFGGSPRPPAHLPNAQRIEAAGMELYLVPDFIHPLDCEHLTQQIKSELSPSLTVGAEAGPSSARTSSTCYFSDDSDLLPSAIDIRISRYLGLNPSYGEPIQGQYYESGEEYKPHHDWFDPDSEALNYAGFENNQRTWTVIIYLNDLEDGGETFFPELNISIKPRKGWALIWDNLLPNGQGNPRAIHQAKPLTGGHKSIITKWYRNQGYGPANIQESLSQYPNYHPVGFEKTKIPESLFAKLRDHLKDHQDSRDVESDSLGLNNNDRDASFMVELPDSLKGDVINETQPMLESWSSCDLNYTSVYGIRIYRRGTSLEDHRDREGLIVSAILNIDQDVEEPWALDIEDHYFNRHQVYLEPGEMLLYEGVRLKHGRLQPLVGESYANLFVHFEPV